MWQSIHHRVVRHTRGYIRRSSTGYRGRTFYHRGRTSYNRGTLRGGRITFGRGRGQYYRGRIHSNRRFRNRSSMAYHVAPANYYNNHLENETVDTLTEPFTRYVEETNNSDLRIERWHTPLSDITSRSGVKSPEGSVHSGSVHTNEHCIGPGKVKSTVHCPIQSSKIESSPAQSKSSTKSPKQKLDMYSSDGSRTPSPICKNAYNKPVQNSYGHSTVGSYESHRRSTSHQRFDDDKEYRNNHNKYQSDNSNTVNRSRTWNTFGSIRRNNYSSATRGNSRGYHSVRRGYHSVARNIINRATSVLRHRIPYRLPYKSRVKTRRHSSSSSSSSSSRTPSPQLNERYFYRRW